MGLVNYGVLIGQLISFDRDRPDNKGKYYHEMLRINVNGIEFQAAIDVDSKDSDIGVEWRFVEINRNDLAVIVSLPNGFNHLVSTSTSGAIDYIRSPFLALPNVISIPDLVDTRPHFPPIPPEFGFINRVIWRVVNFIRPRLLYSIFRLSPDSYWIRGDSTKAFNAFEPILIPGSRIYIFGDRFKNNGNGAHDVHQNQGDPIGSGHETLNAIWQDGCTIVERADGSLIGFFNKFKSQSYYTDDFGHPV